MSAVPQNTWRTGLDRLLLGVTTAEDEPVWLDRALPLDDVDSSDIDLAGRLDEEAVLSMHRALMSQQSVHAPGAWRERLELLCADLEQEARLSALGRTIAFGQLVRLVAARGRAERLLAQFPAIASRPVQAPVVVVGHSHGGVVALALAARHPDLVAGLVVLDAPVMLPAAARVALRVPLTALRTPLAMPLLRKFFAATFSDQDPLPFRAEVLRRLAAVPAPEPAPAL